MLTFVYFRCGTLLTASWKPTTLVTLDTWTPSPFPLTALCALQVARTLRLCSGILPRASTCTLLTTTTSSVRCASRPTNTGSASPPALLSKSGIWRTRIWWTNLSQRLSPARARPRNARPLPGLPMVPLFSPDILTTKFVSGKWFPPVLMQCKKIFLH